MTTTASGHDQDGQNADRRLNPSDLGAERLEQVQRRLQEVGSSLNDATGGAALCRIDGTGGTAKSLEGRMAVLLEVRRRLRRDSGADLTDIRDKWTADLATRRERGSAGPWIDYLEGGVAELDHLVGTEPDPSAGTATATAPPPDTTAADPTTRGDRPRGPSGPRTRR
jgi:hypothetical protein